MLINSIEPVTKERSKIILDTGESFVLYKGELRLLRLKENGELPVENYNQIMKTVLPKRAKLRCLNLLKSKSYTEYQLKKKLSDGGYPEAVIDEAIEYIKSFGYINDKDYAVDYIKYHMEQHSRKEIYLKLSKKGIQKETLDNAFNEVYGSYREAKEDSSFSELELIIKTLKKRGFTGTESYEDRQKTLAYFYRRGFEMDMVYKAMDTFTEVICCEL